MNRVFVIGVGMTRFEKPGRRQDFDYPEMAKESVTKALVDCNLRYNLIQAAFVGYIYGDSTCGQRALYQFGQTQIPIVNVNNNCSTGSAALFLARQQIMSGISDCVMALGFEKMKPGSLTSAYDDRTSPIDWCMGLTSETRGVTGAPFAAQIFGNAGLEYCERYGATDEHMAKIAEKNHRHSALNPYAQFRNVYTLDEIKKSPEVSPPLTKLQCSPTSDGSACVVLASERFVKAHGLQEKAVELVAQAMATDSPKPFVTKSAIEIAGADMTRKAAAQVYQMSGVWPADIGAVELHDCFSANELITYDALGLCPPGTAHIMVDNKDNDYGGRVVVNPSGGLISKGHPLGATGLAQCTELVWQLRGWCEERQVAKLRYALQHNIGLGGAAVVTLYRKTGSPEPPATNPATNCHPISDRDFEAVVAEANMKSHL